MKTKSTRRTKSLVLPNWADNHFVSGGICWFLRAVLRIQLGWGRGILLWKRNILSLWSSHGLGWYNRRLELKSLSVSPQRIILEFWSSKKKPDILDWKQNISLLERESLPQTLHWSPPQDLCLILKLVIGNQRIRLKNVWKA